MVPYAKWESLARIDGEKMHSNGNWKLLHTRSRWHAMTSEIRFVPLPSGDATVQIWPPDDVEGTEPMILHWPIISGRVVWSCFPYKAVCYWLLWSVAASWYGWLLLASFSEDRSVPSVEVTALEWSSCITWDIHLVWRGLLSPNGRVLAGCPARAAARTPSTAD